MAMRTDLLKRRSKYSGMDTTFEKKMMGLGLGVAAGLPAEAAQCVERGSPLCGRFPLYRGTLQPALA